MSFSKQSHPHADWIAEVTPATARSPFSDAQLSAATQAEHHGWSIARFDSARWGALRSVCPASAVSAGTGPHLTLFEGVAALRGELFEGVAAGLPMAVRGGHAIASSTDHHGVYSAIHADFDRVTISTDPLGHSQIYHARLGGTFLLSNRFHLLLATMRALAPQSTTIDLIAVARPFVYETPLCRGTYVCEIDVLPFGSTILFDAAGYHEPKRVDLVAASESLGAKDYDDLVDQACIDIRDNVTACLGRAADYHALSLTGGLDSRMVLAAIMSLGREHDLAYYTYGATSSPDRIIAAELRRLFGLTELQATANAEVSADEQLGRLFSQSCGMRAMDLSSERSSSDVFMMIGGCGENYRGFYSTMMLGKGVSDEQLFCSTSDDFFLAFTRTHGRWPGLRRMARAALESRIRAEIDEAGLDRTTALDSLYTKYRNRYHFGLGSRIQSQVMMKFSPLDSVAALLASFAIDARARVRGKVALDILLRLYPPLAFLPSTSAGWSDEATAGRFYAGALKRASFPMPPPTAPEPPRRVVPRQSSAAPQPRADFENELARRARDLLERTMDHPILKPLVLLERMAQLMATEEAAGNGRRYTRFVLTSLGNMEKLLVAAGSS